MTQSVAFCLRGPSFKKHKYLNNSCHTFLWHRGTVSKRSQGQCRLGPSNLLDMGRTAPSPTPGPTGHMTQAFLPAC